MEGTINPLIGKRMFSCDAKIFSLYQLNQISSSNFRLKFGTGYSGMTFQTDQSLNLLVLLQNFFYLFAESIHILSQTIILFQILFYAKIGAQTKLHNNPMKNVENCLNMQRLVLVLVNATTLSI